jgi:hypothetical protein
MGGMHGAERRESPTPLLPCMRACSCAPSISSRRGPARLATDASVDACCASSLTALSASWAPSAAACASMHLCLSAPTSSPTSLLAPSAEACASMQLCLSALISSSWPDSRASHLETRGSRLLSSAT